MAARQSKEIEDSGLTLAIALDDYRDERRQRKKMENIPLITKYRPVAFEEVIGNDSCIKALADAVTGPTCPHSYLFTGPSGIGKTTLARIIARHVKASVFEVDAGSNSSVDFTRDLVSNAGFRPLALEADTPNRLYILDECHALSKQAWSPLLKLTEEPPPFLYIAFCTTETAKIPETIRTRCYPVGLRTLRPNDIEDLLMTVAELEGWTVTDDTFGAIVQAADGSARRALTILQAGHAVATRDELAKIITEVESENSPVIALCKYLIGGNKNWRQIAKYLEAIEDPEEATVIAGRYLVGAMTRSEESQAHLIWLLLEAISDTRASWDKKVALYAGIGKIVWGTIPF